MGFFNSGKPEKMPEWRRKMFEDAYPDLFRTEEQKEKTIEENAKTKAKSKPKVSLRLVRRHGWQPRWRWRLVVSYRESE